MMSIDQIKEMLFAALESRRVNNGSVSQEDIEELIALQGQMFPSLTREDKDNLRSYLESHSFVEHDHDGYLVSGTDNEDDREWYTNSNHDNDHFWSLYKAYLIREGSMDFASLNKLDEVTLPRIMNCLGNPSNKLTEQRVRYGMVIGDVQSGKTSTYGGLICKAADAGMKVVILLAGQTESLRQQTQERMEEDIVGYTIRIDDNRNTATKRVGVGNLRGYRPVVTAYTSYEDDFKVGSDRTMSSLDAQSSLVMFIVKKNVPVLKRMYSWLTNGNQTLNERGKLPYSLLLIDDEADNASVNTKKPGYEPTATNAIIRKLCEAFMNSNYVGFTATPYANIFINPDKDDTMETTDLFPRDFIYVLPTPSAYIGAMRIFGEPDEKNPTYGNCRYMLKFITDIVEPTPEEIKNMSEGQKVFGPLYYKHKASWRGELPKSLDDALKCFYLANVIRDLDGAKTAPRTMLVNISRYQAVESYVKQVLSERVAKDYSEINCNFCGKKNRDEANMLYQTLSRLFDEHFTTCGQEKDLVLKKTNLLHAIEKIRVIVVNGTKESKEDTPDYKSNPSQRIIAVGGLALSRGLTLRGLMTSYFYRNTATYDTLMQMGRWFGYRPKYDKVCQIWITNTSANWYREIAESTEELKAELGKMNLQKYTPKEFGLRIRRDDVALEITARNKMRSATPILDVVSFWGSIFETPYFGTEQIINQRNVDRSREFIQKLIVNNYDFQKAGRSSALISKDVPVGYIQDFLSDINVSSFNRKFPLESIRENINNSLAECDELSLWDVALMGGSGEEYEFVQNVKLHKALRSLSEWNGSVYAFTNHGVVGGNNDGKIGLDDPDTVLNNYFEKERISGQGPNSSICGKTWFKYASRKPLLIIYPIFAKDPKDNEVRLRQYIELNGDNPIMGYAIGFPGANHSASEEHEYYIDIDYQRNLEEEDETDDEDLN